MLYLSIGLAVGVLELAGVNGAVQTGQATFDPDFGDYPTIPTIHLSYLVLYWRERHQPIQDL